MIYLFNSNQKLLHVTETLADMQRHLSKPNLGQKLSTPNHLYQVSGGFLIADHNLFPTNEYVNLKHLIETKLKTNKLIL